MEISGFISAVIIGIVIGILGRLVVPGRQRIGIIWTILVGVVAALVGTFIAAAFDVADTITVLNFGEVVFDGLPEAARQSKMLKDIYLGSWEDA